MKNLNARMTKLSGSIILAILFSSCQTRSLKNNNTISDFKNLKVSKANPLTKTKAESLISASDKTQLEELFEDSSSFCEVIERTPDCLD